MSRTGLLLTAAGLVVAANAFALGRVAWNRAGAPDASLVLTERELPITSAQGDNENSAVTLRLDLSHGGSWLQPRDPDLDALRWLDAAKLGALGFDVRVPPGTPEPAAFFYRQPARKAYAVLEYQGRAWEAYRAALERRYGPALAAGREPGAAGGARRPESWELETAQRELRDGSRLFVVDVGLDPAALRRRFPDRGAYLILPATVRVSLEDGAIGSDCQGETCRPRGSISLLRDELVVPRRLHAALPAAARAERERAGQPHRPAPRYQVTLQAGALHEPWIDAVRPITD